MNQQTTDTLMMIRPVAFHMNEQTAVNNYYQKVIDGLSPDEVQQKALKEFDGFVDTLKAAGIHVVVFDDTQEPATPDSIFPNNWVSFHQNGEILLYPMFAENRRFERRADIIDAVKLQFEVNSTHSLTDWENKCKYLEGTGSLVLDRVNSIVYAAVSDRTNLHVLTDFTRHLDYEAIVFEANQTVGDQRLPIYHTNVMMCLGEGFALICADSIDNEIEKKQVFHSFENTQKEVIFITEEQKERFAGNMLQVKNSQGEKYIVMSESAYKSLDEDQLTQLCRHGQLLYSSLDTIEALGGGSARCMLAEVFLPKKK